MKNVWFKPEGYQRTSKELQFKCLKILLGFSKLNGNVLDVGCGTGNALSLIDKNEFNKYIGVDISKDMISFAEKNHKGNDVEFLLSDFLKERSLSNNEFDNVICAACLHWFIPHEKEVIDKIYNLLRPGGKLFLSCAFDFDFLPGEKDAQATVLSIIRDKYRPVSPFVIFDNYRLDSTKFVTYVNGFDIIKSHRIEEIVDFSSYEDFCDWHLGSGSVIYQQFSKEEQNNAVEDFYSILYDKYRSGEHKVSYSTGLFLLEKR
ncbi:class I SAM-dependent methyltransferase [Lonsdalea quercina]|uniref:class I SAM-dependent methyltransferase n=2 Tax=Lonsdalea quercina TaxID=71657 RepID=UPI003975147D